MSAPLVIMKSVKPSKLKGDMRLDFLNAMRKMAREITADFQKTTATWDHKPKFEQQVSLTGPGPVVLVGTDDLIYKFVDEGTKEHDIFAGYYTGKSNKRVLVFPGTFTAKTVPGIIGSRAGSKGGETVKRPFVHHPGTKARRFTEVIKGKWEKRFKSDMQDVMKQAARDSGHGVK